MDAGFARKLLKWYERNRRDLPWRVTRNSALGTLPPPYHVLVSEAMLQQTQVATVIPYFKRFIEVFPTPEALAAADEQQVLRLWQGLGYYSRARNLQRAARAIVSDYAGQVPATVEELLKLPGVGRYTAGAIASLAYDKRAPILDGNVVRVLCRIDAVETDPREPQTQATLWRRAEEILPRKRVGDFNSALMELGATVCTPKAPSCLLCPVQKYCHTFARGLQERIPKSRERRENPLEKRWTICIEHNGKWLIEQRPPKGRWAGMWQFVTVPAQRSRKVLHSELLHRVIGIETTDAKHVGQVQHGLTHRRYHFDVFRCAARTCCASAERKWLGLDELESHPMSRPQLLVREILTTGNGSSSRRR